MERGIVSAAGWERMTTMAAGMGVEENAPGLSLALLLADCSSFDPSDIMETYGADTARWFMLSDTPPERDVEIAKTGLLRTQFLWYPWSLASFAALARDPSLTGEDRQFAVMTAESLLKRSRVPSQFDATFEISEQLIGLSYEIRCNRNDDCQP